jgi:hypothetical protein
MNIKKLQGAAAEVIRLDGDYAHRALREIVVDRMLYSFMAARYDHVQRQHYVQMYGSARPHRIDFRIGGVNPIVFELAWRKSAGGAGLNANSNRAELKKLSRVSQNSAKLRALLLIDLANEPLREEALQEQYSCLNAGPGRFERRPVRIIYVHRQTSFHFVWRP